MFTEMSSVMPYEVAYLFISDFLILLSLFSFLIMEKVKWASLYSSPTSTNYQLGSLIVPQPLTPQILLWSTSHL